MKLKKGTLLFLLLTCLAYTTLAQTDYTLQGSDVTINNDGIITECTCAFSTNTGGTNLTIPKSVTKGTETIIIKGIGYTFSGGVFQDKNLVSVEFASDSEVTTIRRRAFDNNRITSLTLPNSINTIGESAFSYNNIETLDLSNSLTTIGEGAFEYNNIETLNLSNSLTTIDPHTFSNNNIETLDLPASLTTIRGNAFSENKLTSVTFQSNSKIQSIESGAFASNSGLTSITLPQHAHGSDILRYKDSEGNEYHQGQSFMEFARSLVIVLPSHTLTASDVDINDQGIITQCHCDNFFSRDIIIPKDIGNKTVTAIAAVVFRENNLTAVTFEPESEVTSIGRSAFSYNNIETLTLPNSINTIGESAFSYNNIETLTLPNSINTIGESAFSYNNIKTLDLPASLTTIRGNAFSENKLTSVTFQNNSKIQSIESDAFASNSGLTSITLPQHAHGSDILRYKDSEGNEYQQNQFFMEFARSLIIVLPSHTLTVSDVDINDQGIITQCHCDNFFSRDIIIPKDIGNKTITEIDDNAFQWKNLTAVTFELGSEVTSIGWSAFEYNYIETLTLPPNLETIGEDAFKHNSITSLTLPNSINTIGDDAFAENNIETLTLPPNLETIGEDAFEYNYIKTLDLPASLTTIGGNAFRNNMLTSVTFQSNSKIQSIESGAFASNLELTSITLPQHAHGSDILRYKDSEGNEYQQNQSFMEFARSLIIVLPSHTLTVSDVDINDQGVITQCHCDNFFSRDIIIPKEIGNKMITEIDDNAFQRKNLTAVTFEPGSEVTWIGNQAFDNNNIETLNLPASLTTIGWNAFSYNNIETLNLPASLTTIGGNAFSYNNIETLNLPASLTTIGWGAFGKNKLTSVTFMLNVNNKSNIREIGSAAFGNNDELTSIALPKHATGADVTYKDSEGKVYNSGDTFSNFDRSLVGILPPYTLTWNDISIDDQGVITECNCDNFLSRNIIIPKSVNKPLDGGGMETITIKGIRNEFPGGFRDKSLQSITFANDSEVMTIGSNAFADNNIETLTLPNSLTTIGGSAFWNNNIETLTLPNSINTIGGSAFWNNNIETLTLPNSINTIGGSAFWNNNIETLNLPASLTTIGWRAFGKNKLTSVTFMLNVNNKSNIQNIWNEAFSNNYKLTSIALPNHAMGADVTYKDSEGKVYNSGDTFSNFDRSLVGILPPYTLTWNDINIDDQGVITECNCDNFLSRNIIIPKSVNKPLDGGGMETITIKGIRNEFSGVFSDKSLQSITFANDSEVMTIGSNAFENNNIETLTLPNSLTTIGEGAFEDNYIEILNLPASLTTIGWNAFSKNKLTSVTFMLNVNNKSNIREIGSAAFGNNYELTSIALPKHATGADVTYKDSEGKVYNSGDTFSNFDRSLVGILPPYTLTWNDISIDDQGVITECNCDNFLSRNIIIPKSVNKPLDGGGMETITIKGIRNEFPDGVFRDKSLQSITFANDSEVMTIGSNAFENNNIETLTLPPNLETIGGSAFKYNNIKTLNLPASLISIGEWAFGDNELKTVTFRTDENNKSSIQEIGSNAFGNNDELTSITLPHNTMGSSGGEYKDSEGKIYQPRETFSEFSRSLFVIHPPYTLTWNDINIDDQGVITECNCDNFLSRNIIIPKSVNKPLDGGGMETITIKGIRNDFSDVFSYKSLQSLTFADDSEVTSIGWRAFADNNIETLTLPNSINTISSYAFSDNNIETLNLSNSLTTIGKGAFSGNQITELTLPNSINTISSYAFADNNIETLTLPPNLETIGEGAFSNNNIETLTLPNSINTISSYAFWYNNIETLTLPNSINTISSYAFWYNNLETLSLPASLISIGEWAFRSNELKEVTFITDGKNKSQIQEIGSNAFNFNNELVGITLPEHINGDKVGFEYKDSEGVVYPQGSIFREFDRSLTSYPKAITSISGESIGSNTPYPNPVQSYLKVDTHKGEQVQILNQEGVVVYSAQITQDEVHTIPVDTLPAGMYLMRITDAEGNTTTKRIVKK